MCNQHWRMHEISNDFLDLTPGSCPRGRDLGSQGSKEKIFLNSKFDIGSFLEELFAIFQHYLRWEVWGFAMAHHWLGSTVNMRWGSVALDNTFMEQHFIFHSKEGIAELATTAVLTGFDFRWNKIQIKFLPLPPKVDGGYVFTHLSVCLWTKYLKKLWTISDETWWMSWLGDKNKPFKF